MQPDEGSALKLKNTTSSSAPSLHKAKSIIDENASETIIAQALDVIFKEIERYNKIIGGFKGADWSTFVQFQNRLRKEDAERELKNEDNLLLDEIEKEADEEEDED